MYNVKFNAISNQLSSLVSTQEHIFIFDLIFAWVKDENSIFNTIKVNNNFKIQEFYKVKKIAKNQFKQLSSKTNSPMPTGSMGAQRKKKMKCTKFQFKCK